MGRHELARKPRKSPAVLAAGLASVAVYFAVAGDVSSLGAARAEVKPLLPDTSTCCIELASAPIAANIDTSHLKFSIEEMAPAQRSRADRSRANAGSRVLPVGVAPEAGLQVKTILVERSISALFPEIHQIGGVRPDALRWHPEGLALDVMIPNPGSDEGIELGNAIVTFVLQNAERFGIQDAIWRGTYYTPGGGAQSGGYGHYDHVHVTTFGGGYPTGDEIYVR
ncbi:hypothetical protein AO501_16715 [Mycobacterium gordonae]|uniref:ARB-07466-like C-terminal domain-containing protein n=1 Tax=Mycobacterium gordonae TaxID=1778 RepID=A0A0Q2LS95_MYCGO|nr:MULTISPECIES: hypothetical protein [Mycobacterium]KQH78889.1 hypothetical protein AO501_16715 [Mycobacterium gordonae]MDP7730620.1 hypothetical protein [Mycobacterium sp. TY813]